MLRPGQTRTQVIASHHSLCLLVPRLTANLRWFVDACASFATNLSLFKFRRRKFLSTCELLEHKSMKVFGIEIKHGGLG